MNNKDFDWLGWQPFHYQGFAPTLYSILVLSIYLVGFVSFSVSTWKVWRDRRAAYRQSDKKLRIIANGNWRATFYRWLTMVLIVILGVLGLTASDVSALPINIRRFVGLIIIILFIGLFVNAERLVWKTRNRLAEYIEQELKGRPPDDRTPPNQSQSLSEFDEVEKG